MAVSVGWSASTCRCTWSEGRSPKRHVSAGAREPRVTRTNPLPCLGLPCFRQERGLHAPNDEHVQAQRGDSVALLAAALCPARRRPGATAGARQGVQDADRPWRGRRAHVRLAAQAGPGTGEALSQGRQERRLRLRPEHPSGALLAQGRAHADPRLELEALHRLDGALPVRSRGQAAHHGVVQRSDQRRDQPGPLSARRRGSDAEHGGRDQARRPRPRGRGDDGAGAAPLRRLLPRQPDRDPRARDHVRERRPALGTADRQRLAQRPGEDRRPALRGRTPQGRGLDRQQRHPRDRAARWHCRSPTSPPRPWPTSSRTPSSPRTTISPRCCSRTSAPSSAATAPPTGGISVVKQFAAKQGAKFVGRERLGADQAQQGLARVRGQAARLDDRDRQEGFTRGAARAGASPRRLDRLPRRGGPQRDSGQSHARDGRGRQMPPEDRNARRRQRAVRLLLPRRRRRRPRGDLLPADEQDEREPRAHRPGPHGGPDRALSRARRGPAAGCSCPARRPRPPASAGPPRRSPRCRSPRPWRASSPGCRRRSRSRSSSRPS